jgi:Rrf2 family transcriptional regulator, iron-sulfur cluster assembly transcription factor
VRLTRGADYGTRGIVRLARMSGRGVVLVSDIALAEGLPESYLAKIFQDLAKEGIVRSHRGAKGGFSLARPAGEITLRQIIEAIEGPIALNRCLAPSEGCERRPECSIHGALAKAQEQLVAILDGTTLQDLAAGQPASLVSQAS